MGVVFTVSTLYLVQATGVEVSRLIEVLHLYIQDVVAACEIVNCNGVEVQCQVPILL